MIENARFVHVNIVARDWRRLAGFYEAVFGCRAAPPERDLQGSWLDRATGLSGAHVEGIHLQLPGYRGEGPTLEIFAYEQQTARLETAINRPGFAHIAFAVDDVETARQAILAAGGSTLGDIVSVEIAGAGTITFVYAADPEGNILEVQHWSRGDG